MVKQSVPTKGIDKQNPMIAGRKKPPERSPMEAKKARFRAALNSEVSLSSSAVRMYENGFNIFPSNTSKFAFVTVFPEKFMWHLLVVFFRIQIVNNSNAEEISFME